MPRAWLILIFLIPFLVCSCGIASNNSNTTTTTSSDTTTTIAGCYIGAFVHGLNNTPAFKSMIGRNLAVNMWYIDWNTSFPTADCDLVDSYGGVPMITWEPWLNVADTLEAISRGDFDSYITSFAQGAKDWGKPVFLRFAHEMNGTWYPWDGYNNGGNSGIAKYISAWKHVHDIFIQAGATNVKWVWSPAFYGSSSTPWSYGDSYYPGDAYVDWIGLDGYCGLINWDSFDNIFSGMYTTYSTHNKSMMIAEFACAEETGDLKADWITDAFSKIRNNYPRFKIFVWFNVNKERDWRVESSSSSITSFKNAVSDPYFLDSKPSD
jgi:hypothetical protein